MTAPQKKARRRAGKRQATGQKKHTMPVSIRQPTNNCDISAAFGGDATDTTAEWPGQPNPPGLTDPEPLPVDALPPALRRHCQSVAAAMQVPSDLPTLLALGCVSAALAGRVEVQVRAGWREPVGLYVACLLPPASRKSPCYSAMTMPVRDWETEQILKVAHTLARTRDLVAVRERALDSAIKAAAAHKGTERDVANTSDGLVSLPEIVVTRRHTRDISADSVAVPKETRTSADTPLVFSRGTLSGRRIFSESDISRVREIYLESVARRGASISIPQTRANHDQHHS